MPPRALLALFGGLGIAQCPFRGVEPLDLAALKQPGFLYAVPNVFLYAEKPYADCKRLRRLLAQPLLRIPPKEHPPPSFKKKNSGKNCYLTTLRPCYFPLNHLFRC